MQNLPGEVPGFYFMNYDLSYLSNQTPEVYFRKIDALSSLNYIPLFVYHINEEITINDDWANFPANNVVSFFSSTFLSKFTAPTMVACDSSNNNTLYYTTFTGVDIKASVESNYLKVYVRPFSDDVIFSHSVRSGGVTPRWNNYAAGFAVTLIVTPSGIPFIATILYYNNESKNNTYFPTSTSKGVLSNSDIDTKSYYNSSTYSRNTSTIQAQAATLYNGAVLQDSDNPYNGGDSQTDPGDGSFDYTGDEIGIPDLPAVSVTDSGFVTLYAPTTAQLNSLASFMWSDAFSLDSFKKLFNNPMDCILGLSIIPVNVPTGGAQEITVGNIISTVSCNVVTSQFIAVDCGTLTISPTKFTGGYLDYSPYTKAYIYLPFIGIQQLNIDDIMNSTLHVVYHVDILTGALVCYVQATNRTTGGVSQPDAVLYTYMGQCAESVPLSSTDFSSTMSSILSTAGAAAGLVATVATGGAAAPVAAAATGLAASTANTAMNMKPNISRSGAMGGSAGMMNIKFPFVIFDCPHTAIPIKQYEFTGFPSNKIVKLSSLSGFNVIQAINLSVAGATDQECDLIKSILTQGVII